MIKNASCFRFRGQFNRVAFLVNAGALNAAVTALTFCCNAIFAVRVRVAVFCNRRRTECGIWVGADVL
ncbi:MAG: hypothetical protein J6T77_07385, partial [Clostridia bacterium]|nr:hypothetical protein [Clostridia bacterium]